MEGCGVNKSPVLSSGELSRAVDRTSLQTFQAITVSHVRCSKLRLSYPLLSEKIHVIRGLTNSGVEIISCVLCVIKEKGDPFSCQRSPEQSVS